MLSTQEHQALLSLISSDRLTIRGNEALTVAVLQQKLASIIKANVAQNEQKAPAQAATAEAQSAGAKDAP